MASRYVIDKPTENAHRAADIDAVGCSVEQQVGLAGDLPHGYVNAGPQVARFALTVFEPGVGPGSRSEATDG
jgi:hypothetical protein